MSNFLKGHKIVELSISSPDGVQILDVRLQSGLISYYEDVTDSSVHVTVDIQDTNGFMSKLPIRSGSQVNLSIQHPSGELIYSSLTEPLIISNILSNAAQSKREAYTLDLVTKGAVSNHTTRVYKKYKGKISSSVRTILTKELGISNTRIKKIEETSNDYEFMGNYKRPLFTCTWLSPKSIPFVNNSKTAGSAGYLFYETLDGYNFRSIDNIFNEALENRSNIPLYFFSESADALDQRNNFRISSLPIWKENHDILDKLRRGTYRSSNWFYNIITRQPDFVDYNIGDSINKQLRLSNELANVPADIASLPSRIMLGVVDTGTLSSAGNLTTPQYQPYYQSQGIARYSSLFSQTLNITVPMNLTLRAGDVIYCKFPKINMEASDYGTNPSSGYYMIKALSHKFSAQGDFTGLKLVRDSYVELS
jgi:hypothetical protein